MTTHTLQNNYWQAAILPGEGASLASARVRYSGAWLDVLRPTPPDGKPGSFLMLPWANRIREGRFVFNGVAHALRAEPDDGTARHGDVRKRAWEPVHQTETAARYRFNSADHADFNWPFALGVELAYTLEDADFIWEVMLTNHDTRPFPAGFGFHPYFQRHGEAMPRLQIPCSQQFPVQDGLATGAPGPISPALDFREARGVPDGAQFDDLLTDRDPHAPVRLIYTDWGLEVQMHADAIFRHVLLFTAPDGTVAVEPQTNANDGFNLHAQGVPGTGVFVVEPGASVVGAVRLRLVAG